MIPNSILFISLIICLLWHGTGTVRGASLNYENSAPAQGEDIDYWVQIRNVSIFNEAMHSLEEEMFVLVVGTHIHKIGKVPMMIFDKDLTFNYDGEGRILMSGLAALRRAARDPERVEPITEGLPANLWVLDVRTLDELSTLMAHPDWSASPARADLEVVKLILEDGWVAKDTLPRKRIDGFRLERVKLKRQEMGLPVEP